MKTKELKTVLKVVETTIPKKSSMPILECVLIRNTDKGLSFTVTDSALVCQVVIPDEHIENDMLVNFKTLQALVKIHDSEVFNLENLEVKSTFDVKEFPNLQTTVSNTAFYNTMTSILPELKALYPAVCKDFTRPSIMGIKFEIKNNVGKMYATDGFQLAWSTHYNIATPNHDPIDLRIYTDTLKALLKIAPMMSDFLAITYNNDQQKIQFSMVSDSLVVYLTQLYSDESCYPDCDVIIPKKFEVVNTVNSEEVKSMLTSLLTVWKTYHTINDKPAVKVQFDTTELKLSIRTTDNTFDFTKSISGNFAPCEFAIQIPLFLNALEIDSHVDIGFNHEHSPIGFNALNDFGFVVMPFFIEK